MIGRCARAVVPVLLLCPLLGAHGGGWAVITVEDVPDFAVAQQRLDLTFMVRQHGHQPMNDLNPVVEARLGDRTAHAAAQRGKRAGEYVAALTLPEPGDWRIEIDSRFGDSRVSLPPLRATGGGAHTTPTYTAVQRGERLFVAKGCVTCHQHRDVASSGRINGVGPDLSEPRLANAYLAQFLADPSIRPRTANAVMPNLELKANEISALVAFLNTERK